ncbi:MAG: efflux RND transporter periplasmic adaptor subunit [Deltaproteobacteria bacterium]|nr:efflux RND transporter periplasmic adaptor subunit [Deltaproteobacteria bacterium]
MRIMKIKLWQIIAISVLCLALVGAIACPSPGGDGAAGADLVEVVRGDLTVIVSGSGNITVSQDASLAFGTGGKVEAVYVEAGDQVSQGDVLARLDTGALELYLAQAQLALSTAEYNLDKTQQVYARPDINAAKAAVSNARSYLNYAELILDEANSIEEIEYWENEVYQAEVNLAAAEQRRDEMLAGGDSAEVTLRRLEVAAARQALAQAEKDLAEATITAPFEGIVGAIYVDEGDIIPPPTMAPTVAIYFITPTGLELKAEVDEIDIPDVEVGQSVIIEVDAIAYDLFEGTVTLISPVPIIQAGLVLYEVNISLVIPADAGIMVGMSATADIMIEQSEDTLLVPERAVGLDDQGNTVVRVSVEGQLEVRPVVIGISDGLQTEILEGLSEGDMVSVEKRGITELGGFF